MPIKPTSFLILFCLSFSLYAQQPHVNVLANDSMNGRGYVNNGMGRAAAYIAEVYHEKGVFPLPALKGYFQPFSHPVNSLPGDMTLKIDSNLLDPGHDYLVDPGTPSVSGSYSIEYRYTRSISSQSFLLMKDTFATDKAYYTALGDMQKLAASDNFTGAGILVVTPRKLTWHVETRQKLKPVLTISEEAWIPHSDSLHISIDARFIPDFQASNVVGVLPGESDSIVLVGAHYDHLGMMGRQTIFPGANDNASGTAMLLELAEYFAKNKPHYTMLFVGFASEEAGLLGSDYFTRNPPVPLDKIKFMINLDLNGTGDEGITVVNGKILNSFYEKIEQINETEDLLPEVKARGEACNSDHCPFHMNGVPSFFIYARGGIQAYHDVHDKAETLPLTEFTDLKKLLIRFISVL